MILFIDAVFQVLEILRVVFDLFTHSPLISLGLLFLLGAVVLSIINGLIDIAVYIALIGGSLLLVIGVVSFLVSNDFFLSLLFVATTATPRRAWPHSTGHG